LTDLGIAESVGKKGKDLEFARGQLVEPRRPLRARGSAPPIGTYKVTRGVAHLAKGRPMHPLPNPLDRGMRPNLASSQRTPLALSDDAVSVRPMRSAVSLAELLAARLVHPGAPLHGLSRGRRFAARVQADGSILVAGKGRFDSPSLAANSVVGSNTNGWTFWRLEDGRTLADLRQSFPSPS